MLTSILLQAADCARELRLPRDLVEYSLELLGAYSTATSEQKVMVACLLCSDC